MKRSKSGFLKTVVDRSYVEFGLIGILKLKF